MTPFAAADPALSAALDTDRPVLVDVGCGDGRYTVRWAERRPDALVVGLDAETTRLDRSLTVVRRRKLPVLFVGAAVERVPAALVGRAAELAVVMPWGSLLDGVLGADPAVLRSTLSLARPGATLEVVVNVRPWDAPASVDRKLAATPEPTADHLAALVRAYAELGWTLEPVDWLTDPEARALGSTWASRVVSARASRLLRLRATHDPTHTAPAPTTARSRPADDPAAPPNGRGAPTDGTRDPAAPPTGPGTPAGTEDVRTMPPGASP